ncbi:MAG: 1-deoxy-D-xylulose-5-phosphate reductoisomerase [Candidatus Eisenbacteria bacterium]|uniref:1-deoxy-D-xylulose 5-phosphate reductoisomerase n=1 Tax=Eiseniibacteriota bacterium TaxID=2212470 RepID=A0A538SW35_UNCEI|nr:MAG: 1-deoxy-D-xylulose-5-phosphate reductoisomerase [Candidatus Eisenbacteria bacterium]TMQ61544.1 MAG: 1-deoxy-D-xylulose-5-phosphate reductoisomerase [Candidatus Eisenbacteria bacterium]
MIRVALLGATGSIGSAALDLAGAYRDRIRIVSLAARSNDAALTRAADGLGVRRIALVDAEAARRARDRWKNGEVLEGESALTALAEDGEADVVINAVVGSIGLKPTVSALSRGKRVALANKESVVLAGELLTAVAKRSGGMMIPVDSEHSGVFQCLAGRPVSDVRRVTLTASGGPFLRRDPRTTLDSTPEEVLKHPTWSMGERITVDCATLVNKGFEVIEARWLFDLPPDRVDVVIHPQSIVHALVEFVDGSIVAQLSVPDMRLPLLFALSYPERWTSELPRLGVADLATLTFEPPDPDRCPGLALARRALTAGGTAPAVLNAADEEAVRLFLDRKIRFGDLMPLVEEVLTAHRPEGPLTLESILEADRWARGRLHEAAAHMTRG